MGKTADNIKNLANKQTLKGNEKILVLEKSKCYTWEPKPDITVFELAQILPCWFNHALIENLHYSLKRHFKEVK